MSNIQQDGRKAGGMSELQNASPSFLADMRHIIQEARRNVARSVDFERVVMYWRLGERIFVEEQQGKDRAGYGEYLIQNLAQQLEMEFGSGFSYRQLAYCRKFYQLYPIVNALRSQLGWFQYRLLIAIDDNAKREYYELESVNNAWTGRETERQINSLLYERLLMSNDKEAVLAVARKERIPEKPSEIIKDPMVLEFLGLKRAAHSRNVQCYSNLTLCCSVASPERATGISVGRSPTKQAPLNFSPVRAWAMKAYALTGLGFLLNPNVGLHPTLMPAAPLGLGDRTTSS